MRLHQVQLSKEQEVFIRIKQAEIHLSRHLVFITFLNTFAIMVFDPFYEREIRAIVFPCIGVPHIGEPVIVDFFSKSDI